MLLKTSLTLRRYEKKEVEKSTKTVYNNANILIRLILLLSSSTIFPRFTDKLHSYLRIFYGHHRKVGCLTFEQLISFLLFRSYLKYLVIGIAIASK